MFEYLFDCFDIVFNYMSCQISVYLLDNEDASQVLLIKQQIYENCLHYSDGFVS